MVLERRRGLGVVLLVGAVVGTVAATVSGSASAGSPTVSRYAGADRFETAAVISQATFRPGVPVAYVATGGSYADALAGTPAAAVSGGPILLTNTDALPSATANELSRLMPARIVVLGGSLAVSDSVVQQLQAYTTGSVTRLMGPDRYGTAAAVSSATFPPNAPVAYVATDAGFADALSGGAAAGETKGPVLITQVDAIPGATASELTRLKPGSIVVLGGTYAVSDSVAQQLQQYTTGSVSRLAGADRFETSVAVSQATYHSTAATVYLATGYGYADALAGGVAAALAPGPLLLVQHDCVPPSVGAEINRLNPAHVFILGGTYVVGPDVDSLTPCSTAPATTTQAPPTSSVAPSCSASMSNPSPGDGGTETANVTSNLPNSAVSLTAHYRTTDSTYTGTTDASGNDSITFGIGRPTVGYTVVVDVTVGGQAHCQTSFTPQ